MTLTEFPLIAGSASALIFVVSYLPMLLKARRTKDLSSSSPTQLLLTNIGNLVYSAHVYNVPAGPIWALHSFNVVTSCLMLI
jgi:uncharacterized protein with PQ loop repeat